MGLVIQNAYFAGAGLLAGSASPVASTKNRASCAAAGGSPARTSWRVAGVRGQKARQQRRQVHGGGGGVGQQAQVRRLGLMQVGVVLGTLAGAWWLGAWMVWRAL